MLYSQKTHPNTLSYCTSELEKHLMLKQSLTGSLTSVKDSSLNLLNKMDKWAALVQGHIPALETKYFSKRHNSPSMERHPSLAEEELSDCQVLSPGTPPSPVMLPPSSSVSLTNNNSTSGRSHQRNSALELGPEKNGNHSTDSLLFGNRITWRKKTSAFSLHSYSATRRSPSTGFEPLSSKRGTAHSLSPPHQPPKMRQQLSVAPRSDPLSLKRQATPPKPGNMNLRRHLSLDAVTPSKSGQTRQTKHFSNPTSPMDQQIRLSVYHKCASWDKGDRTMIAKIVSEDETQLSRLIMVWQNRQSLLEQTLTWLQFQGLADEVSNHADTCILLAFLMM